MSLIYLIEPLSKYIPYVEKPQTFIKPKEKLVWTGMVLFIYLVYSQIPLYGIYKSSDSDPIHYLRVILASSRGTLAELGIFPVVTTSFIFNILRVLRIIKIDPSVKSDIFLLQQSTKFLTILITLGQSIVHVFGGFYGPSDLIGPVNCFLLILQLFIGGMILITLDEILSQKYGFINGISLFIAVNVSQNLMWKCFSPFTVSNGNSVEYEGAIIAFFHFIITKKGIINALYLSFFRKNVTNLSEVFSTFAILLIVIYLWKFKLKVKLISKALPGATHIHKIKLLYSSMVPLFYFNLIMEFIPQLSQTLYNRYPDSFIIKLIGTWNVIKGHQVLTSGLAYFFIPPKNFYELIYFPIRSIIYIGISLGFSGYLTWMSTEYGGSGAVDLCRELRNNGFFLENIKENEDNLYEKFQKIIPTVSFLSGMIITALKIIADLLGAIGSGNGILILVSTILKVYEQEKNKDNINVLLEE